MFLPVPAHPGSPGQKGHKTVVVVVVVYNLSGKRLSRKVIVRETFEGLSGRTR